MTSLRPGLRTRSAVPAGPRRRALRSVLLAVGTAAVALPGTAQAAAVYGLQDDIGATTVAPERVTRTLDTAKRAGAELFRVEANWAGLEPVRQGERDPETLATLDRLVDAVAKRGMKTVLFIDRTPCWASAAPASARKSCDGPDPNPFEVYRYRPRDPGSVVPIATFLAARYGDRLGAFQVWNEPDQSNEHYWAGDQKVETYVAMVRALYGPLKAAAPRVPVLAGSFVGTDGRWLKAMYDNGLKGYYDGLAVQFYSAPLYGLRETRAIQTSREDLKPVWMTEFGFTSCYRRGGPATQIDQRCVSRRAQARGVADILTAVRKRPWIAATIQYDVQDDPAGGYTFGITDTRNRLKPVWTAVRNVLRGRTRSPKRPTVQLRRAGDHVVASGTSSLADVLSVRVLVRGQLAYRARLGSDALGRWRIVLPPQLGTRLTVKVGTGWTGAAQRRI